MSYRKLLSKDSTTLVSVYINSTWLSVTLLVSWESINHQYHMVSSFLKKAFMFWKKIVWYGTKEIFTPKTSLASQNVTTERFEQTIHSSQRVRDDSMEPSSSTTEQFISVTLRPSCKRARQKRSSILSLSVSRASSVLSDQILYDSTGDFIYNKKYFSQVSYDVITFSKKDAFVYYTKNEGFISWNTDNIVW